MKRIISDILVAPAVILMLPILTIIMLPMLLCLSSHHLFKIMMDGPRFERRMIFAIYINLVWIGLDF